jgi:hypothetical protein
MKKAKDIEMKVAAILSITNETDVLSEMRGYAESLSDEQFEYAHNYAKEYLAKRTAAMEEAFAEAAR